MKDPKPNESSKKADLLHFHDVIKTKDNVNSGQVTSNIYINNYLRVFKSIHQTLETNSDIVSLIPGFFEAREVFKDYLIKLSAKYSGIKETLINLALIIADALRNYGVMTENAELISFANMKESCIKNFSDFELIYRTDLLLKNAKLYLSAMNYFGISYETLSELETIISKFSYTTGLFSENFFYSPEWRDEFDRDFDEAYSFIQNTLDNYLEKVKEQYPKFYTEYNTAKELLNPAQHI